MRNKAFLPMIEQLVMIALFALAAALCLQGFAAADRISDGAYSLDRASHEAQNAAEVIKSTEGDLELAAERLSGECSDGALLLTYSSDWKPCDSSDNVCFTLRACKQESSVEGLGKALITVSSDDETVFELTVSWQEVAR